MTIRKEVIGNATLLSRASSGGFTEDGYISENSGYGLLI